MKVTAFLLAFLTSGAYAAEPPAAAGTYYVGDGDAADFGLEVSEGNTVVLYLTHKPTNEAFVGATVSLQPANGKADIAFTAGTKPGIYSAVLLDPSDLPGQILIQSSDESDAIETTVPKYRVAQVLTSMPPRSVGTGPTATRTLALMVGLGFLVGALSATALCILLRKRVANIAAAATFVIGTWFCATSNPVEAHAGHDHGGPSLDDASSGSDVVMPKKSQLLVDLRTVLTKRVAVPAVLKSYGHVIPKPQLDAVITAPQAGFIHGTQGLAIGRRVRRGEVLGSLQAVNQIRLESPIEGEISELLTVDGSRVDAGAKLFRVTNSSVLWVDAELFAAQLAELKNATDASIAVEGQLAPIKAKILNAVSPVSEETRTAKVFLELVAPPKNLRIGTLASVFIAIGRGADALPVPASAVLNRAGDRVVFVQTGPETFVARGVVVADSPEPGTVLLTQGVSAGERVVISGNYQLLMKAK